MAVHYHCRHCATKIGSIDAVHFNEEQLGLHSLTEEERHEMISYGKDGSIYIQAICDNCHEAFIQNPNLHQFDYLIH